jgi:hypothetical protein
LAFPALYLVPNNTERIVSAALANAVADTASKLKSHLKHQKNPNYKPDCITVHEMFIVA